MQGWDRAWEVAVLACRYGDIKLSKGGVDDEAKALRVKVFRRDFFKKNSFRETESSQMYHPRTDISWIVKEHTSTT